MVLLRSIDDFPDASIRWILQRAALHAAGTVTPALGSAPLVGLLFLETSLRTRIGFQVAATRIGGQAVVVEDLRHSAVSMPESLTDTLRTLMGYTDVVVARVNVPLDRATVPAAPATPVLSGGDRGPLAEHPTQALIDRFAIEREFGAMADVSMAICGDLRMRTVTSLLKLLSRTPVRRLTLVSHPELMAGYVIPDGVAGQIEERMPADLADVDLLYVAGIPHGNVGEDIRSALRVKPEVLAGMRAEAVITSPLPVIDEVDPQVRADRRFRAFAHSDAGLYVRMAVLERVVLDSLP